MTNNEDYRDAATDYGPLTQRQAENIADLAARRAQERMYAELGRSVVRKALFACGAILLALSIWISGWVYIGPSK